MDSDSSEGGSCWESADEKLSGSDSDVKENYDKSIRTKKKEKIFICSMSKNNSKIGLNIVNSKETDISNFRPIEKMTEIKMNECGIHSLEIGEVNEIAESFIVNSTKEVQEINDSLVQDANMKLKSLNINPERSDKDTSIPKLNKLLIDKISVNIVNLPIEKSNICINSELKEYNMLGIDTQEEIQWDDECLEPREEPKELEIKETINIEGLQSDGQMNNASIHSEEESSWGSWGNWASLSSVLSTAASISSSVSQGITSVLETSIGVPGPEELAKQHNTERHLPLASIEPSQSCSSPDIKNSQNPNGTSVFGFGNIVSGVSHISKLVETTSSKVISGGLDTLETIGKKTMEVLQENDPGLKKKRAFLKIDKPVLSQILREAKERSENENIEQLSSINITKKPNYETIFDDFQGLIHLEALEMLSKQCEIKLEILISKCNESTLQELQQTLDQIKELCELADEDDSDVIDIVQIKQKMNLAISEINIPISYMKLFSTWDNIENILNSNSDENKIHQLAIEVLAQLSAISVEQFHKAGELLLIKQHRSTADEADSLLQLTTNLIAVISIAATRFSNKLHAIEENHSKDNGTINSLITNIYFEAANSSSYIQNALQLLIPVLQVGAT